MNMSRAVAKQFRREMTRAMRQENADHLMLVVQTDPLTYYLDMPKQWDEAQALFTTEFKFICLCWVWGNSAGATTKFEPLIPDSKAWELVENRDFLFDRMAERAVHVLFNIPLEDGLGIPVNEMKEGRA